MSIWIVIGTAVAIVAVAVPVGAIMLVSFASLSEESAHTLGGQAPGATERVARRLLGFHTERSRPTGREPAGSRAASRRPADHAQRDRQAHGAAGRAPGRRGRGGPPTASLPQPPSTKTTGAAGVGQVGGDLGPRERGQRLPGPRQPAVQPRHHHCAARPPPSRPPPSEPTRRPSSADPYRRATPEGIGPSPPPGSQARSWLSPM